MDYHYYYHANHDGIVLLIFFFVILPILSLGFYFLPSIIALNRRSDYVGLVCITNLLVGWTFFGWFIALYMALTMPGRVHRVPPVLPGQGGFGPQGGVSPHTPPPGWGRS
ncbi:superinfection immunity protein [Neokomagataea anthophila]|uniref:Superinfection immunity protein n=1 Tax=Neokomagataea anthophila TaxID=2826925 RepID=A0ABS5E4I7_9PROT|nr:superinfection immunity protein [Neokomagataea anthophila]MBR0558817.1 superinfection immunity protein [Neokomagataea anthophila]